MLADQESGLGYSRPIGALRTMSALYPNAVLTPSLNRSVLTLHTLRSQPILNVSVAIGGRLLLSSTFRRNEVAGPVLMDEYDAFLRAGAQFVVQLFAGLHDIRTRLQ